MGWWNEPNFLLAYLDDKEISFEEDQITFIAISIESYYNYKLWR